MAVINFENSPSTNTPISATNLNEIQKGNIYSTSELVVGKWVNNKPIYKKTFIITHAASNTDLSQAHGISNLEDIVDIKGAFQAENTLIFYPLSYESGAFDLEHYFKFRLDGENIYFYCGVYLTSNTYFNLRVTLEYTKSTN